MIEHMYEVVAKSCHEANRTYCESIGDDSQVKWAKAADWQKESAISGVKKIHSGEIKSPGDSHRNWAAEKIVDGWVYGEVKDPEAKTHHCLVPFDMLPIEQQTKDWIFFSVATHWLARLDVPSNLV